MLRFARVGGESMSPTLENGDFVLALGSPWAGRYRCGDVVLVKHATLGLLVKRIVGFDAGGSVELAGDGVESCSSASLGRIPRGALVGRAVLRIAPAPRGTTRLRRGALA